MLIALRFNLSVDYNIELPQNKTKASTAATNKAEASSSFKGFGFFKTLNTTWFNKDSSMKYSLNELPTNPKLLTNQHIHSNIY